MKKAYAMCACLAVFLLIAALACADSDVQPHLEGFPYESFEYTQELTYGSFKIYIPSSYVGHKSSGTFDHYNYPGTNARIGIFYDDSETRYTSSGELIEKYLYRAKRDPVPTEFARADECIALITVWDIFGWVDITLYNQEELLVITIYVEPDPTRIDRDERDPYCAICKSIAYEILDHIVAPEIPLE